MHDVAPLDKWLGQAALVGASAVLLASAFPHPGWGLLAHVALAPATVVALGTRRPGRFFLIGYLAFFAWWLSRIGWIAPVTVGGYVALCAYLAVYAPASFLLTRRLAARGLPAALALPLAWVSLEQLRRTVLAGGFGWLSLAQSQAPFSPEAQPGLLVQSADVIGETGVSLLVAATGGVIVDLVRARRLDLPRLTVVGAWAAATAAALGYGAVRIQAYPPEPGAAGPAVAVVQTDVPQSVKNRPSEADRERMWRELERLTRRAAELRPDPAVIVWPETALPVPLNREAVRVWGRESRAARRRRAIGALASEVGTPLIVGAWAHTGWRAVEREGGPPALRPRRRFNSAYLFAADESGGGRVRGRYDKLHRVPFGEYIPWVGPWPRVKGWLIRHLTPYDFDYTLDAGARAEALRFAADAALATPICFEDTVPRVTRRLVRSSGRKAPLSGLVNLSNEGWFVGTAEKAQHLQQSVLRCIEHRVSMARSVNTGSSGFVDPAGRIGPLVGAEEGARGAAGVAAKRLHQPESRTLYRRLGNGPAWTLVAVTAVLAGGPWGRRRVDSGSVVG